MPADLKYLRLLAEGFPTTAALCTEITRLNAQLSLPKGTEHFMSDIHGEVEAFTHIMNNCSGVIREKVNFFLGDRMTQKEVDAFCTLIYYPEPELKQYQEAGRATAEWLHTQVERMVYLAQMLSTKYTREKVRRAMPEKWAFLLDELIHFLSGGEEDSEQTGNRLRYRETIVDSLIQTGSGASFIVALAELIKRLAVDRLHVVGDIFDRGPRADSVMDILMRHHTVDIEWGNHDILWMGAAAGSEVCVACAVRNSLAYSNMDILERGYGIPLRPLALLAEKLYPELPQAKAGLWAITVMLFKLEGQVIARNPEFGMDDRLLLDKIDRAAHTVTMDGVTWPVKDLPLNTVDPENPYDLTSAERQVMDGLCQAFTQSERLHQHISFLYRRGSLYRVFNDNLLFHGCVPMDEEGQFLTHVFEGQPLSGRALMDYADQMARRAFMTRSRLARDFMWYLWCGSDSPVCGRQIKTFARAFIPDEAAWHEPRNPYYTWYNQEETCDRILAEFGVTAPYGRIINGHTPVRVTHGESPLKAGGKLVVIDGGFCRAYQKTTGIAGYTLIANSHGMRLMSHQPFTSLQDAQANGTDIHSQSFEFMVYPQRQYNEDTTHGRRLRQRADDLTDLLAASLAGEISLGAE